MREENILYFQTISELKKMYQTKLLSVQATEYVQLSIKF